LETRNFETAFELTSQISTLLSEKSTPQNLKIFKEIKLENELKKEKLTTLTLKSVHYNFMEDSSFEFKSNLEFKTFWKILSQDEFILKHHLSSISKNLKEIFSSILNSENFQVQVDVNSFHLKLNSPTSGNHFDSILAVVQFFNGKIFTNPKISKRFWKSMDLEKNLKKLILKEKNSNKIQTFLQHLKNENIEFESMDLFLENLDFHSLELQKEDSLSFVRTLFDKSNNFTIVEESNVGSLFYFPKCTISDSCKLFVKKIQNTRQDVLEGMLDLYLLLLENQGKSRETMLIYNDCIYISHHLFMLSFWYFNLIIEQK
jgi:hypothetical protein